MSYELRIDFGSRPIRIVPNRDVMEDGASTREFVCLVRPTDTSRFPDRVRPFISRMHDVPFHPTDALVPGAGPCEASLAQYLSRCLDDARERSGLPTKCTHEVALRSDLVEQLCLLIADPPMEMEPFLARAFAVRETDATTEPPRSDRVFARTLAGFPAPAAEEIGRDLGRHGGFVASVFRASAHVAGPGARLHDGGEAERWSPAGWSTWLAGTCGIEVRTRRARRLLACLVRTASQRVIWLSDQLLDEGRASAILHELSHWLLDHRPNTDYGADPARLTDFGRVEFQRQEREADAFGRLLQASLESLRAVMFGAGEREVAAVTPRRAGRGASVAA